MDRSIDRYDKRPAAIGSLEDMARRTNTSIAETFINCDAVVLVDTSGSMMYGDVRLANSQYTRYHAACDELTRLQRELPGKIGVVAFSDEVEFCPSGVPRLLRGGTLMHKALEFVRVVDGCDVQIILISDGEPNAEDETLRVARTFQTRISTIYIGKDGEPGQLFLKRLADATGGKATRTATDQMDQLSKVVKGLLTT